MTFRVLYVAPQPDEVADGIERETDLAVTTATSATAASDRLAAVDCVVSALDLPEQDGVSFLRSVRDEHPALPTVLFADAGEALVREAFDAGVTDCVRRGPGAVVTLANRVGAVCGRNQCERQLADVDDLVDALTDADSATDVGEAAVTAVRRALDCSLAVVALYDDDGTLVPKATANGPEAVDETALFDREDGIAWEAFLGSESVARSDLSDRAPVDSCLAVPLGKHGVLLVGDTDGGGIETTTASLARVLAATVEAALDRLDREQAVAERESALTTVEDDLEQVQRRERLVRDVMGALAAADSRDDVEQAVCERVTNAGPFRFAWIGEYDTTADELTPRTWVGGERDLLDGLADATNDAAETTARSALRTRELAVDDDLLGDPPYEAWRQAALRRGYRAAASVPLSYRNTLYGVLTVYAAEASVFGESERSLLAEIGDAVAYAINTIESKKALVSDSAVELEFRVCDPEFEVIKFVQLVGCRFEFESVIREADDTLRVFFTTEGADPEAVLGFSEQSLVVDDIRHVSSDDDRHLFESTVTGTNVVSLLLDHGAIPKAATAENEEARLTVELPQTADVRRFVETFQSRYDRTELVARRKRDRPVKTEQDFRAELQQRLTERQREALETAYWSGFFEWPRESTGQEIAASLDVSQPTFNRHLRAAERNLFTALFDDDE